MPIRTPEASEKDLLERGNRAKAKGVDAKATQPVVAGDAGEEEDMDFGAEIQRLRKAKTRASKMCHTGSTVDPGVPMRTSASAELHAFALYLH